MTKDVFDWLVEHHYDVNLPKCQKRMVDGMVVGPDNSPLREGYDSLVPYSGVLIAVVATPDVMDTDKLNVLVGKDDCSEPIKIRGKEDFLDYLRNNDGIDGAHLYDPCNGRIMHVNEFKNGIPIEGSPLDYIPTDFFTYDNSLCALSLNDLMGTRTRMAIKLPHARDNGRLSEVLKMVDLKYDAFKETADREEFMQKIYDMLRVTEKSSHKDMAKLVSDTYQIKQSVYGTGMGDDAYLPFGPGKVTHFTLNGLSQEYFFVGKKDGDGYTSGPHIRGMYREWNRGPDNRFSLRTFSRPVHEPSYKPPNAVQNPGVSSYGCVDDGVLVSVCSDSK